MDSADRKLETSSARPRLRLSLYFASFATTRHFVLAVREIENIRSPQIMPLYRPTQANAAGHQRDHAIGSRKELDQAIAASRGFETPLVLINRKSLSLAFISAISF